MDKTIALATMEKFDNRQLNSVGSSRIRMRWMLPYWEEAEEYGIGKKYEVMVFQKVYWEAMMDVFEGISILDLCDPDWLENKPVFEFVDRVDAVVTSTEELAKYVQKLRPEALVRCIPDRVYLPESPYAKFEHGDSIKSVVWFGYSTNSHYLVRVFDEIISRGVELVVISDAGLDVPYAYKNKLKIKNIPYSATTVDKEIVKCDAVIMPDAFGDERAKYKSPNKTVHSWALGMPVIKLPDDFDRLALKEDRITESLAKRKEVEEYWDVKQSVVEYKRLIEDIKARKISKRGI